MTIVRGKGSLPYWIQIPTTLMYGCLFVSVKLYGEHPQHQLMFNKVIPLFVLVMYLPNMAMSDMEAYDSEVVWAFCLSLIFTLF
jgi:hypothetical protein